MVYRGFYYCFVVWESDVIILRNLRICFGFFFVVFVVVGFIILIVVYKNFGKRNIEVLLVVLVYF